MHSTRLDDFDCNCSLLHDSAFDQFDVDLEVGFGEDQKLGPPQNDSGNKSRIPELHLAVNRGQRLNQVGKEDVPPQRGVDVFASNIDIRGNGSQDLCRDLAQSCSKVGSGRARSEQMEDFQRYSSMEGPRFRRSLSDPNLHISCQKDAKLTSATPELEGASSANYEELAIVKWMPTKSDSREHAVNFEDIKQIEVDREDRDWQVDEEVGIFEEKDSLDGRSEDVFDSTAENIHEVIQNMLAEMSQNNSLLESDKSTQAESDYRSNLVQAATRNRATAKNSDLYSRIFLTFEDLLSEGDGIPEEERKTVDDMGYGKEENEEAMQQQNMRKSELEKQLQNRINWQELQHGRFLDMRSESEAALTAKRERSKNSRREVDRSLEMLKKERKSHQETMEKLRTCVQSLMKFRENLAVLIEAGIEHVTEDFSTRENKWELERLQWKEREESFKKEREELEKKIMDITMIMEGLKTEITMKEIEMETERKRTQAALMQKETEAEKLNLQLKSREHDMEVNAHKFMHEIKLIATKVEKERKEREEMMELHFASKRKIVKDMKEREERWDRDMETMKQELENAKMEIRLKEKEIDELKRSIPSAPFDLECQVTMTRPSKKKGDVRKAMKDMSDDVLKVSEDKQRGAVVAKDINAGERLCQQRPMLEILWQEYCRSKRISDYCRSITGEPPVRQIPKFEKEILAENTAIKTFRDELKMKLVEKQQLVKLGENHQEKETELMKKCQVRQQELIREKEAIQKSFKVEQCGSAEAISSLQGVVRELKWALKQSKFPQVNYEHETSFIRGLLDLALMEIKRNLFKSTPQSTRGYLSPHGGRDWDTCGTVSRHRRKWMSCKRAPRTLGTNLCLTLNGLATLTHDRWAEREEPLSFRQLEDQNNFNSTTLMSPWISTDKLSSSRELPAHGVLGLPASAPHTPFSHQQKWVVDVSWLHQVRKEHTWLRKQLEIERQRVAALIRVEARRE